MALDGGTFRANSGGQATFGAVNTDGGTFGLDNNTTVTIDGNFVNGGTLDADNVFTTSGGNVVYAEGGSSLTIEDTLANTGVVQVGNSVGFVDGRIEYTLNAPTTITLGGLTNGSGASFTLDGSAKFAATLAFSGGGTGYTSNGGVFELAYAAMATGNSFTNTGTFGLHNNTTVTIGGSFANSGTLDVDNAFTTSGGKVVYAEGGSNLTIGGTLSNAGTMQVGRHHPGDGCADDDHRWRTRE